MDNNNKIRRVKNSKMKIKIGLFTIIVSLMIGCSEIEVPKENFYAYAGDFGESRFPLIKPFYMFFSTRDWAVIEDYFYGNNSGNAYHYSGDISDVQLIKAFDNLFLFRSYGEWGNLFPNGEWHMECWFIIDIENKIEEGYIDYKTFSDTLQSRYQITIDTLSWRTPESYYEDFRKERFMPWFPDSITNNTKIRKKHLSEWLKGI